jgi:biotin carboxylase
MRVEQATAFRDKEVMKGILDRAGIRTPRHRRASTERECRQAAEEIGYPLIVKPIAGAGSADTWPVHEPGELEPVIARLKHVDEVSVEEFVQGEEFTYDTVCAGGEVLYENVAWYKPKPLEMRLHTWISPQAICLRRIDDPTVAMGPRLGRAVLGALGSRDGFTHMEWFRTPTGEAVFGEIGARPAGGRLVHGMNYSCDIDLFTGWAEAVCHGRLSQDTTRRYNASVVFKRASGPGATITRVEGLESLLTRYGEHICHIDLARVGDPRRDPHQVIVGDGWLVGRHPDLDAALEISSAIATDLRLYAD